MMKNIYEIDRVTGIMTRYENADDIKDRSQGLISEGVDSEFHPELTVFDNHTGSSTTYGGFVVSRKSNLEGESNLNIEIGNCTLLSIKRKLPKIEFEFEIKDNTTNSVVTEVYDTLEVGLKQIAAKSSRTGLNI
jgi:hypothetical protein